MWFYIGLFLIVVIVCLVLVWIFSFDNAESKRCPICHSENTNISLLPGYYNYNVVLKCNECGYEEHMNNGFKFF